MRAWLLGSGGWMPTEQRETACVLIRDGRDAVAQAGDATAAEAAQVARAARARQLTLVHISPLLTDESELVADARAHAPSARIGCDRASLLDRV